MVSLLKFLKPYLWLIITLVIFTYFQVIANLMLPDYTAKIVNDGIIAHNNTAIYTNGAIMILITLAGGLCAVVAGFLASRAATGAARDVRNAVFRRVESFSITEFNKFSTASLITRSTNDIQQIQMVLVMMFRLVLIAPFMAIGALQNAVINAPSLSWIIALAVTVLIIMIITLFVLAMPKFAKLQEMVDKLNLVTRENLTGLRVVRAFNNERREEDKFRSVNQDLTSLNLFVNRLMTILMPGMSLILNFAVIGIVWFSIPLISNGSIQIGNMIAFMQYAVQVIMSFLMISIIFIIIPRSSVSAKRVAEVLNTKPSIKDPSQPTPVNREGKGQIEFKNVTFTYPDADLPVLTDINFTANPGQTTAFIGSTGSGKSTIINLIPRFYDVSAGQILLDGIDIRDLKLTDLYSQIGYVPQKGVLFSGTVKSNISYGDSKLSESEVEKAARVAQAAEFIEGLEKKFDNEIAQGGANVSGGQKQRLSIARALAVNPKVYIFDDSFSALDFKTDALLRHALVSETKNRTVLIVGQRISTIMHADKIIVLDEGRIVGQGTHQELLQSNDVYREIAYSQLSDEELKAVDRAAVKKTGVKQ